jgi:hypothetical protein
MSVGVFGGHPEKEGAVVGPLANRVSTALEAEHQSDDLPALVSNLCVS